MLALMNTYITKDSKCKRRTYKEQKMGLISREVQRPKYRIKVRLSKSIVTLAIVKKTEAKAIPWPQGKVSTGVFFAITMVIFYSLESLQCACLLNRWIWCSKQHMVLVPGRHIQHVPWTPFRSGRYCKEHMICAGPPACMAGPALWSTHCPWGARCP